MTEFYQTWKEELTPTLLTLFQKVEREGTLPNSFYEASIILIQNPRKMQPEKRIIDQHFYRCKDSQQNTGKQSSTTCEKIIHHDQVGFIPGMQAWFNIQNSTFLKVAVLGLLTFHLEYLH
jgi:hypothetical protein